MPTAAATTVPTATRSHPARYSLQYQLQRWIALGAYFGYPQCCVKDFLVRATRNHARNSGYRALTFQRAAGRKQGFVPCQRCAMNLLLQKRGAKSLIRNRVCASPYPYDGSNEELERYLDTAPQHDDHTILSILTA